IGRSDRVFEAVIPAVLEQKVVGAEAKRAWRLLLLRFGDPAPGPAPPGMRVCPPPRTWIRIPSWEWHRAGVELVRARTIIGAARDRPGTAPATPPATTATSKGTRPGRHGLAGPAAPGEGGEVRFYPAGPRGGGGQGPRGVVPGQQPLVQQCGISVGEAGEVSAGRGGGHVVRDDLRPGPGDRGVELLRGALVGREVPDPAGDLVRGQVRSVP